MVRKLILNSKEYSSDIENLYSCFIDDIMIQLYDDNFNEKDCYYISQLAYQFCMNFKYNNVKIDINLGNLETKISKG